MAHQMGLLLAIRGLCDVFSPLARKLLGVECIDSVSTLYYHPLLVILPTPSEFFASARRLLSFFIKVLFVLNTKALQHKDRHDVCPCAAGLLYLET